MLNVYGIKNCSTVRKSLNWLDEHSIDFVFFDVKKKYFKCQIDRSMGQKYPGPLYVGKFIK